MIITKLVEDAKLPTRKFPKDAGLDFYSLEDTKVSPLSFAIVRTGIGVILPEGYAGQLWPKSRSNFLIGGGIVDENYRGEILVKIANITVNEVIIKKGDAIAQMVITKVITSQPYEYSLENFNIASTDRGATGGIVSQVEKGYSQLDFIDKIDTDAR